MSLTLNAIVGFLVLGLRRIGFCWLYSIKRERLWWAIIPGLLLRRWPQFFLIW